MNESELQLTFLPAFSEVQDSAEYQASLLEAEREMRSSGVRIKPVEIRLDDPDALLTHSGQWVVPLGVAAISAVGLVASNWLKARQGRRVQVGEVSAPTVKELEQALKLRAQYDVKATDPKEPS